MDFIIGLLIAKEGDKSMSRIFEGYCTWYSLAGRTTASGEMYRDNTMTAAMTSEKARLNSIVTVCCKSTNKCIKVRVNDRGPFMREPNGRAVRPLRPDQSIVIDLTPSAFKMLAGSTGVGKIIVTVEVP